jgi:hypothetical protein
VALVDVVRLLRHVVFDETTAGETFDIGCPEVMTYAELMKRMATILGRRLPMLRVPWYTPRLSLLWVVAVTGYPAELVFPLVESARHHLTARNPHELPRRAGFAPTSFDDAARAALRDEAPPQPRRGGRPARPPSTVRSVQRLPLPTGWTALDLAMEYAAWIPFLLRPLLKVVSDGPRLRFHLWPWPRPLLELTLARERSEMDRQLYYITGGDLARLGGARRGRLELRTLPSGHALAAIHDYAPTLPWPLYAITQAPIHLWVMAAFGRHLARVRDARGTPRAGPRGHAAPV